MKRRLFTLAAAAAGILAIAGPAHALRVADPVGGFTDSQGNAGYVEVAADDGAVFRGCNENEATPGGDETTGYMWVNPNGEATTPSYGNENIGAGDADGEGVDDGDPDNGTEGHDCA